MTKLTILRALLVATVAAAFVSLPRASGAAFPANNAKLSFVTATGDIASVPAAGAGASTERSGPGLSNPAWSPLPNRLAYDNGASILVNGTVFVPGTNPAWSPDGTSLFFQLGGTAEIFRITYPTPAAGEPKNLTNSAATDDVEPAVSPDGSRVAFARKVGANYQIYVMNASDGTNQQQLTSADDNRSPTWSPDGSRIAFASHRDGNWQIYSMNADGSSQTRVTNEASDDQRPSWSPDGTLIAFDSGGSVKTVSSSGGLPPYTVWAAGTLPEWADGPPAVVTPPEIFPTTPPTVGGTLTATTGTWSGSPSSFTYQWFRCDAGGGNCTTSLQGPDTNSTYTVTAADIGFPVVVQVVATNVAGDSAPAQSLPAGQVAGPAPRNLTPPSVTGTASADFGFLFATPGSWTGTTPMTFTYQWLRCFGHTTGECVPIPGAKSSFYAPTGDDIDTQLDVAVVATNSAGSGVAYSDATPYVTGTPPRNHVSPVISGSIEVGSELETTDGTWFGSQPITFTYQWRICKPDGSDCNSIPGATGTTYTLQPTDYGSTIRIMIRGRNGAGIAFGVSNHTLPILHKTLFGPAISDVPTVAGPTRVGLLLTATAGIWTGESPITFAYAWQRCDATGAGCKPIARAKKAAYKLSSADVGSTIRVAVTATNVVNKATIMSDATDAIAAQQLRQKGRTIVGKRGQLVLVGTPRDDTIVAGPGNVTIYGMGGFDSIRAGSGNDVVYLGTGGSSKVWGGAGSNTIYAANGERDTILCGKGPSRVFADPYDVVKSCTVVTTTSPAPTTPTPPTPPT